MSTRNFQPGDAYGIDFTVKASTGALADADSLPTASLYRNGAADGAAAVTVAKSAAGVYRATCTIPGSYAAGDRISLLVAATVGGVATGEFVDHARLVGFPNTALPNAAAGAVGGVPLSANTVGGVAVAGGVVLTSVGLDQVPIETGINARQALALIGAATAGKASGLDTSTATFYAMGASGTSTARVVATTDAVGNRAATTLTVPA